METSNSEADLQHEVQEALASIDTLISEARSRTGELLTKGTAQLAFNRELLSAIAEQLQVWETQKPFSLRISQLRGLSKLVHFLAKGGNKFNTGYFRQPTGAGKTVLYSLIAFLINKPTVIFVPKNNLLEQTRDEMVGLGIPEASIGIVGDRQNEAGAGKQFLIVNYASHNSKMHKDPTYTDAINERELVICDEAHRSLGKVTRKKQAAIGRQTQEDPAMDTGDMELTDEEVAQEEDFLKHMDEEFSGENKNILKLGFTATTELRSKSVHEYFHELIAEEKYAELVAAGILVPFKVVKAARSTVYEDELDYISEEDESQILEREGIYDKLLNAYIQTRDTSEESLYPIVFCATHKECDKYVAVAKNKRIRDKDGTEREIRCRIVTSREKLQNPDVLKEAERDLLSGAVDQIVTVDVLTEGWNLPPVNCAIIARASQSPARIVQGVGRTSRWFSGDRWKDMLLHTPFHKTAAYVIEAEWLRMMRTTEATDANEKSEKDEQEERESRIENVSGGITPLDFAQAMAYSGEDPSGIISRADGKDLQFTMEAGSEYQGRSVCTLTQYAKKHSMGSNTVYKRLQSFITSGTLKPIPHLKNRGTGNVYFEEDIDQLFAATSVESEQATEIPPSTEVKPSEKPVRPEKNLSTHDSIRANEQGKLTVDTPEGPVQALTTYGTWLTLQTCLPRYAEIDKMVGDHGFHSMGMARTQEGARTLIYRESDILKIKAILEQYKTDTMSPHGVPLFHPDAEGKMAASDGTYWTMECYAQKRGLDEALLKNHSKKLGISGITMHVLLNHNYRNKTVYREADLDAMSIILPKNGRLSFPDIRDDSGEKMRTAVSLSQYATELQMPFSEVKKHVTSKQIYPIQIKDIMRLHANMTTIEDLTKRTVKFYKITQQDGRCMYVCAAWSGEIKAITGYKQDDFDLMYWLNEVEEAMKDSTYHQTSR